MRCALPLCSYGPELHTLVDVGQGARPSADILVHFVGVEPEQGGIDSGRLFAGDVDLVAGVLSRLGLSAPIAVEHPLEVNGYLRG